MRAGRKRKQRGHLMDRQLPDPDRHRAALQPHRAWLPPDKRLSEKAATPLGGLNLMGFITDLQYEAGCRYRVIVGEYRSAIGVPDASRTGRGYLCRGEKNCDPCQCLERKLRYDAAFESVMQAGQRAARCVAHVAVHDQACPTGQIADLRRGLDALVKHFGLGRLTRNGKSCLW